MKNLRNYCNEVTGLFDEAQKRLDTADTLLDAYLYRARIKCGKPTCKCMTSNYRHESDCLSFTENGGEW